MDGGPQVLDREGKETNLLSSENGIFGISPVGPPSRINRDIRGILMGGAGRHCHCKASNFSAHAQKLPGAQTIKIPYVLSDVGKFIRIFKNLPQNLVKNVIDYQQV